MFTMNNQSATASDMSCGVTVNEQPISFDAQLTIIWL